MRLVLPSDPLLIEPCDVVVAGVEPGATVAVTITCDYGAEAGVWVATESVVADAPGSVHIGGDRPWWSADRTDDPSAGPRGLVPTTVTATAAGDSVTGSYTRRRRAGPVRVEDADLGRCRTRTYLPEERAVQAGLVVVGGSGGGMPMDFGWSLLASLGCAVTTVHYFHGDGLPDALSDIPVEVCLDAADRLGGRPYVLGISRGSELALLAASTWPDRFAGAIGVVPSGVPLGAFGAAGHAWTVGGEPVPYAQVITDDVAIAVERIDGPLVTFVAGDDRLWPSADLLAPARRRRDDDRDTHLVLPDAGHGFFGVQGIPVPDPAAGRTHPVDGRSLDMGVTRAGDAAARRQAWTVLLDLLT